MVSYTASERRARAVKAALEIAARYQIKARAPVLLKDANNTLIHLAPAPVVAKVGTSTLGKHHGFGLAHELNVALHLAQQDAPIVPPSRELPPALYWHEDLAVTFWQYCAGEVRAQIDQPALVAALKRFHTAFASYQGPLPSFTDEYEACRALLDTERLSPELAHSDRQLLRAAYTHLRARLRAYEAAPVHTEVHGGNVLWPDDEPRLIDFESCARGPRELDFLSFSRRTLSVCPDLDQKLMTTLRGLKSFCVAVWCWAQPDRAPEVREAAEYHLRRLRRLG